MFRSALIVVLFASPAMAFEARNDLTVTGDAQRIVVASSPGQAASQSWCAAGDYVIRKLGLPMGTPVYRISEPPRRQMQTVEFSLSPEGAATKSGLIEFGVQDAEVSAGHAQSLCVFGRFRY